MVCPPERHTASFLADYSVASGLYLAHASRVEARFPSQDTVGSAESTSPSRLRLLAITSRLVRNLEPVSPSIPPRFLRPTRIQLKPRCLFSAGLACRLVPSTNSMTN